MFGINYLRILHDKRFVNKMHVTHATTVVAPHYPIAVVTEVVDRGTKQFANCQGATRLQTSQSSGG